MADFNKDSIPDLAVVNYGSGSVTILTGDGKGGFTPLPLGPMSTGGWIRWDWPSAISTATAGPTWP